MKREIIKSNTENFEGHAQQTENGIEFWFARDLQHLLGYAEWRNFLNAVSKAKTSCEVSGNLITDHFVDVNKMVQLGSGSQREIDDIMLTRFACYLIAQNGDPQKEQIAFAQNYFAVQTRKYEIIEKRLLEWERLKARQKLMDTEKQLSGLIFERTGNDRSFAIIRSKGDEALFGGRSTKEMKIKLRVPDNRPLADFLPTITIKAKDFATEITIHNTKDKGLNTEAQLANEHITNNIGVRKLLQQRGIVPENLPAEEDIKKMERRLKSEDKKLSKSPDSLKQENDDE